MLKKLLGPRVSISKQGEATFIQWSNYGIELLMLTWILVYAVSGIVGWVGDGTLAGYRMIPLAWLSSPVLTGMSIVCLLHLLFNRKSLLIISSEYIRFRVRMRLPSTFHASPKEIKSVFWSGKHNQDQDELGAYEASHPVFLLLKNGRRVRLGSFGEEDARQIFKTMNKHIPSLTFAKS